MRLENLKVTVSAKNRNDEVVNFNIELGVLELNPNEHSEELKLLEKLLPLFNNGMNKLAEDMAKKK